MTQTSTIGIYGITDSGKTTLAEQIITYFTKQGLKIATIKQTDKTIILDKVGKDTFKHKQSGALCSVLSSAKNTDIMIDKKIKTSELIDTLLKIERFDLIVIEGAADPSIAKIRIGDIQQRSNTILDYNGDFNQVIEVIHQQLKKCDIPN
jgi:molybdopterin-guanine dinucleotide biosynthesis adapter protein